MKILFMGTPDLAAVCLEAVYNKAGVEVVGVLTQPDKPKGRGMKLVPPPVKVFAEEHGIPVYQPQTLKNGTFEDELKKLDPDICARLPEIRMRQRSRLDSPEVQRSFTDTARDNRRRKSYGNHCYVHGGRT